MSTDKRTYADRRAYIIKHVAKRRKELIEKAVAYKGGKCEMCGYKKYIGALEFHHIDPKTKDHSSSKRGDTISWERKKRELDKCILLCANCHREVGQDVN